MSLASLVTMGKKKADGRGRPKKAVPLVSIVSLKGEPALAVWLDKLMRHTESGSVANTLRRALKHFASAQGFPEPMPER